MSDYKPGVSAAQAALPNANIIHREHPAGAKGVRISLQEVADRIKKGRNDPRLVAWARQALHNAGGPQTTRAQAQAILTQLKKEVSYMPDPVNTEFMASPAQILCLDKFGLCFKGADCFPETTLLLRDDFEFVAIKDIKVGDRIWGRDKWTTVKAKAFKGKLWTDAIRMNNGSTMQLTPDHHVFVVKCDRHSNRPTAPPCSCPTEECRIERVRVSELTIKDRLIQPKRISFGTGTMDPGIAYIEGLYVSDGWSSRNYRFCISGQDGCPKEKQKKDVQTICERLGIRTTWHRKSIDVCAPEWTARIHEMGTHAPQKHLLSINLDEETAAESLRGVMADSGANSGSGVLSRTFTTTSHKLMLQTRVLHRMFGVSCGYSYIVDHGGLGENPIWRLSTRVSKKREKILRVKDIDRRVRKTNCYDIQTEDHYVYLPEHDVTVSNCDELVITYASATLAVGIPTQIIGEKFNNDPVASHVLAAIQDTETGEWLRVDPSTSKPVGQYIMGTGEQWIDPMAPSGTIGGKDAGGDFVGVGRIQRGLGATATTPGSTTALWFVGTLAALAIGTYAYAKATSKPRAPIPGEKRLVYKGKPFSVHPSQSSPDGKGWVLDVGDEMHDHYWDERTKTTHRFMTSSDAVQYAHKRINSSSPPRFH